MTSQLSRRLDGFYSDPTSGSDPYRRTTGITGRWPQPWMQGFASRKAAERAADLAPLLGEMGRDAWIDTVRGAAARYTNRAAGLGTAVHHAVEHYLSGERTSQDEFDPQIRPYIDGFTRFLSDWEPTIHFVEVTGYRDAKPRCAGTLDLLAALPEHGTHVVDVKTGRGLYETHCLQMSSYVRFERLVTGPPWISQPMPRVDGAMLLHLGPGSYDLCKADTSDEVFLLFRALAYVDAFMCDPRPLVGDPLTRSPAAQAAG